MDNTRAEKSLIEQRFRAWVITHARKRNHGNGDTQMHKSDVSACGNAHMEKGLYTIVTYQSQVRKQKNTNIAVSILCIYFHLFTYIQCINDIHYAASCFSTKYLLPLLSLLIDPKYAVVPSCLLLSLIRVCDDNLQPLKVVVVSFCFLHVPMMCPVMCRCIVWSRRSPMAPFFSVEMPIFFADVSSVSNDLTVVRCCRPL